MEFVVTSLGRDTTLRLSCRAGDQFLSLRWPGMFDRQPRVRDVWRPKDGEWLLLTSRIADLPSWFTLHPTETSGRAALDAIEKLRSGYQPPDPVDGPNIWRLMSGDRITWTGEIRSAEDSKPKREIFDIRENALAIAHTGSELSDSDFESEQLVEAGKAAFDAACRLGLPRTLSADGQWTME
jgi:hypothetical protein